MQHMTSDSPTQAAVSRRILVVDDNVDGAVAMSLLLKYDGHDTRIAHNGDDAMTAARAFLPEVVILDIGLPGKDGYDVARELRGEPELRDAVLIALSGWGEDEDFRKSREAGFDHHLVKPVEPEIIETMLRTLTSRPSAS